jgi:hypothetical protein
MALLFIDGFDHYAAADFGKKWNETGAGTTMSATGGRRGTAGVNFPANTANLRLVKNFPNTQSWVAGFALRFVSDATGSGITDTRIIRWQDSGTQQVELRVERTTRKFLVTRNGATVTGGTSDYIVPLNQEIYVEMKVTIADSIGSNSCIVRVNGTEVINVAAGQDLKNTANAYANSVMIGPNQLGGGSFIMDDLYICDQSGSTNNDFLGDCRIDLKMPSADGFYTDGTPSTGSDNFAMVNATPVGTGNFVTLANNGDRDSYQHNGLPAVTGSVIYGVQVNAAVDKDDAGTRDAATFIRSGTVDEDGASVALGTTYGILRDVYELNPDGNVAWNTTTVDNAEFGVVVTA